MAENNSGKAEKGPFRKDTDITAIPYDLNWDQSGFPKEGSTEQDDGSYQIYSAIAGEFVRMRIEGDSYNEVDDVYDNVSLRDISRNNGETKNLNPLTHILDMVAFKYCRDENHTYYHQGDNCIALAQSEILSYLNFTDYGVDFNKMSLQGDTTSDAQMAVFSFHVAGGRTGSGQNDYLREVANGILENNLVLKQSIQDDFSTMKFVNTRNNLRNKYTEIGLGAIFPKIELLPFVPFYYGDLFNRTPIVRSEFNIGDFSTCTADTDASYTLFAIPHIFSTGIELSKYLATNLNGDISVWTRGFDIYDRPGTEVLNVQKLREVILDSPEKLAYNGFLGNSHGLVPGTEYYIVIETTGPLSTAGEGGLLPFGRKLASNDGGATWIGNENDTPWWRKSGVVLYTID
jgi:hypothetical protein